MAGDPAGTLPALPHGAHLRALALSRVWRAEREVSGLRPGLPAGAGIFPRRDVHELAPCDRPDLRFPVPALARHAVELGHAAAGVAWTRGAGRAAGDDRRARAVAALRPVLRS